MKGAVGKLVTGLCAAALIAVVGLLLVPGIFGLQRYVITGGSMSGTIAKGSLIYSRIVPVEQLRVGDIITFNPPGSSTAVTHRLISIQPGRDGRPTYSTKGDFNQAADPWNPMTLDGSRQAREVFHVPLLGYVLAALSSRSARLALIGLPALLIALSFLWSLWKEAGEDVRCRLEEDGVPHDARSRA